MISFKKDIFSKTSFKFAIFNTIFVSLILLVFYFISYRLYIDYTNEVIKNRSFDLAKISLYSLLKGDKYIPPPGFDIKLFRDQIEIYHQSKMDYDDRHIKTFHYTLFADGNKFKAEVKVSVEDIIDAKEKAIIYSSIIFLLIVFLSFFISYYIGKIFLKPIENYTKNMDITLKTIFHGIKTPLSTLKLLSQDYRSKKALQKIDDILFNIKLILENKKSPAFLNVNEIIKDILESYEDKINEKGLNFKIEEKEILSLFIDPEDIRALLDNVISNAIKHSEPFSEVEITISKNSLKISNKSKPIKDIEKIFDMFYRESEEEGMGLGLYIVKELSLRNKIKLKALNNKDKFMIVFSF